MATVIGADDEGASTFTSVAFSGEGERIAAAGLFNEARVWNAATGAHIADLEFDKGAIVIGDEVVVAAGGDRLLALSRTGAGAQWKFSDLTRLADVHVPSRVRSAGFAAEGSSILAVGDDGGVFVFDAASGTQRHALRGDEIHVIGSAFSGDGRWSAVSAADGTIRVWNVEKEAIAFTAPSGSPPRFALAFDPAGTRLAAGGQDQRVVVWELPEGRRLVELQEEKVPGEDALEPPSFPMPFDLQEGEPEPLGFVSVRFSPDGNFVAAGNDDGRVCLWDVKTGAQLLRFRAGATSRVQTLSFDGSGSRLAVGLDSGAVRVFDLPRETRPLRDLQAIIARLGVAETGG